MTPPIHFIEMPSSVGPLRLSATDGALAAIRMLDAGDPPPPPDWVESEVALASAREQLEAYFAGELREFDLPLAPRGTDFQQTVWQALRTIPFGETISYAELARRIGSPRAVRAVGGANGRNPLPIVLPCHRVVGAGGSLTGYGGGLHRKRILLSLEGVDVPEGSAALPQPDLFG